MIEIEFENPNYKVCECCGSESVSLTRFVSMDGDAHAVYYCQYTIGHENKVVNGIVSLGKWWEGSTPSDRVAFPFRIWMNEDRYQVGLMDKSECQWAHTELLGTILDRKEALNHKWIKEAFHITDHIVMDDRMIIEYFK